MLALKCLLLSSAVASFVLAAAIVGYDLYTAVRYCRRVKRGRARTEAPPIRGRTTVALLALAWVPLLFGLSMVAIRWHSA